VPDRAEEPLVLVVDDNERNLKLARDVLGAAGLRTLGAASGREAIAIAAEQAPDVILLDLQLPDRNGTEVVRDLPAGIPVVAFSASPYAADDDGLRAAGFAGYLLKPIDVAAFPDQVRSYVR
jgi:two-component system cell cycle response regulator DivK